jgi:hypothetical protein
MVIAAPSLAFSILFIWYSRNTGHDFFGSTGRRSSWPRKRNKMTQPGEGPPQR